MPLFVQRTQHAIGQGGFHTSYIHAGDRCFSVIFDCGGSTGKHRAGVLAPVAAKGNHDWLVISHLDTDHINGIAELESKGVRFSNVFLPHVDLPRYLFLMLLKGTGATTAAAQDASLSAILTAGRLYAGAYGRVRVVTGGNGDGDGSPFEFLNPNTRDARRLPDLSERDAAPSDLLDAQAQAALGASGAILYRDTQSIYLADRNWELRFYSDEWSFPAAVGTLWAMAELRPLRNAMENLARLGTLGGGSYTASIDAELKKKLPAATVNAALRRGGVRGKPVTGPTSVRSLLKKLYGALPGLQGYNSASLCLYSGPRAQTSQQWRYMRCIGMPGRPQGWMGSHHSVGWLGMGDAHLHDAAALKRFQSHYGGRFRFLSTLVLPHHGSRHNYDAGRIQLHRLLAPVAPGYHPVLVAASNPNHQKFKHPHQEVVDIAAMYGQVHNVNLNAQSTLDEIVVEHG